ncbi:MAG: glycosyltransferase [Firmicutes bacterium]|nr:glycosyltransferase [Bacillota bacterium]
MTLHGEFYMENKCDVLILSAMFGLGHITVSKSIKEHLKSYDENLRINIIDIFEKITPKLHDGIYKGYELLIKNEHKIYNYFYYKKKSKDKSQLNNIVYNMYKKKFAQYIADTKPKLIISTFPMCSKFVSKFKEEFKSDIPLITCITDVVDSWEWIHPHTDRYFVATDKIKKRLYEKGIKKDKIKVTGIPVRKEFLNEKAKHPNMINIEKDDFVILIMGGGVGLLPKNREFYYWLDNLEDVKTIILTGKNKKAYNTLIKEENFKNIKILGYTENVADLMSQSNIIVTKAGGVTLFEAINTKLPIVVYKPLLGQEIENCKFIIEDGIGTMANDTDELKNRILELKLDKDHRKNVRKNLLDIQNNINIDKLAKYILELYYIKSMKSII